MGQGKGHGTFPYKVLFQFAQSGKIVQVAKVRLPRLYLWREQGPLANSVSTWIYAAFFDGGEAHRRYLKFPILFAPRAGAEPNKITDRLLCPHRNIPSGEL